jgi:UDP-N-acetyl-alpha-D-muramoyl-L-alanyl-L-glutamate epimerase
MHGSISSGLNYFSMLRPLSELQIARLFSDMPESFQHFKSCNVGSKTGTWCGSCPKCLFSFIILSPFLKPGILTGIFGHNLLADPALENTFDELTGKTDVKPFECIGTVDEVNSALFEAVLMYDKDELPYLLKKFQQTGITKKNAPEGIQQSLNRLEPDHYVPERYLNILIKALR